MTDHQRAQLVDVDALGGADPHDVAGFELAAGGELAAALLAVRRPDLVGLGGHHGVRAPRSRAASRASGCRAGWARSRRRRARTPSPAARDRAGTPRSSPASPCGCGPAPSRSRSRAGRRAVPPPSWANTLISWVRPGVFDTRASCFLFASALSSDDLPTFDRPTNATSAGESGSCCVRVADWRKRTARGRPDTTGSVCLLSIPDAGRRRCGTLPTMTTRRGRIWKATARRRLVSGAAVAAAAALVLGACSSEDLAEKVAEEAVEQQLEADGQSGDVDIDIDDGNVSIQGEDGEIQFDVDEENGLTVVSTPEGEMVVGSGELPNGLPERRPHARRAHHHVGDVDDRPGRRHVPRQRQRRRRLRRRRPRRTPRRSWRPVSSSR